ncbi:hypothetical protein Dimus_015947 [Dionaea muscipula]
MLFRGSPSPRPPRFRWGPPSPGTRTRSHKTPSPMLSSSTDSGEVNSSEEGDASEAIVTASEVQDLSDSVDGILVSSLFPDLSPILEDGGRTGVSSSSISESSVLSPTTAVLECQAAIDAGGCDFVSSLSSSLLGADVSASSKRVALSEVAAIDEVGLEVDVAFSRCSYVEGLRSSTTVSDVAVGASVPHIPLARHRVEDCGLEGDGLDREFVGGERGSSAAAAALSPVGSAVMSPVRSFVGEVPRDKVSCSFDSLSSLDGAHVSGGAVALPFGSNLHMAAGPLSNSYYQPIGGLVGRVGDGLVSEEGRVSPAAREALRSQPADGLRQPPSSLVKPVICAEGAGGQDGRSPDWRPVFFRGSPSPRPPRFRWGPPSPGTRTRSHKTPSLMMSSSTDPGEVSSSEEGDDSEAAVTASEGEDLSDLVDGILGSSPDHDLNPILEDGGMTGASSSSMSGSPVLSPSVAVLVCQAAIDAGGRELVSSLSSLMGADVRGDRVTGELDDKKEGAIQLILAPDSTGPILGEGSMVVSASIDCFDEAFTADDDQVCSASSPLLPDAVGRHFLGGTVVAEVVVVVDDGGVVDFGDALGVMAGLDGDALPPMQVTDGVLLPVTVPGCLSLSIPPCHVDTVVQNGDGGLVREEAWASRVVREALRSQPTDGLRQPPSTPVVPVSGAESGDGKDGTHGGGGLLGGDQSSRSYARVFYVTAKGCRRGGGNFRWCSGGRLAPPASPRRRCSFVGCQLTHPRRSQSFVKDCLRALRAVKPTLVWDYESLRNREFWVRTVVERVLKEEPSLLLEENQPALTDLLEGRGSFVTHLPDLVFSPMFAGSPIQPDLGTCLVGTGSIEGVVVTEEVSLKGEEMEFELRPDLDSSPRHRVELLPADEEQGMPATSVQEGAVSIGCPDSMLAANLMVGLDGEGEPVTSPVTDGLRVNGLGFTAAIGADPVVAGPVDVREFQLVATVPASSLAVSALGVQVMDDGGGQRPRLVEPDGGLTSTCSSDVVAIDVQ